MPSPQTISDYIEKYRNKATVVRQIHSNIAESKRKWDLRHTLATIVLGATFTFTGFMGADRIFETIFVGEAASEQFFSSPEHVGSLPMPKGDAVVQRHDNARVQGSSSFNAPARFTLPAGKNSDGISSEQKETKTPKSSVSKSVFNLLFSAAALSLFIVSTLNLIYRWKEDHALHFQGVVKLTAYINWIDELKLVGIQQRDLYTLKRIRDRYQSIVESLPPNDEEDYLRAKLSLAKKDGAAARLTSSYVAISDKVVGAEFVSDLIKESSLLIMVLKTLKATDANLWLGGGSIRNHIWDRLTGRVTLQDDFDVVYFDADHLDSARDKDLEQNISRQLPSTLKISVKNQARMHLLNAEPPTKSLENAIAQWPETATAIAVQLDEKDAIVLIAPYDYADLLNMVVSPTPYHESHRISYEARKAAKGWEKLWPELTVRS